MTFYGFGEFAEYLFAKAAETPLRMTEAVNLIAENFKKHLESEVIGSDVELLPLAQATQDWRVAHGFSANEPLLMTGSLKSSLQIEHMFLSSSVGSNDKRFVYMEFGTSHVPPRPAFQIALGKTRIENIAIAELCVSKMFGRV